MARALPGLPQPGARGARADRPQIMENIRRVAMAASQASSAREPGVGRLQHPAQRPEAVVGRARAEHAGDRRGRARHPAGERAGAQRRRASSTKEIEQMTSMVELVGAISENSTQISRIADAISRIASQTNMLVAQRLDRGGARRRARPRLRRRRRGGRQAGRRLARPRPGHRRAGAPGDRAGRTAAWRSRARSAARCRRSPAASPRPTS